MLGMQSRSTASHLRTAESNTNQYQGRVDTKTGITAVGPLPQCLLDVTAHDRADLRGLPFHNGMHTTRDQRLEVGLKLPVNEAILFCIHVDFDKH